MNEKTPLDWSALSSFELEQIEESLDRWELARDECRANGSPDPAPVDFCTHASLVPYFVERVFELDQIDCFRIGDTDSASPMLPETIGNIDILEMISKRIASTVYRGAQPNPQRIVAIKVLDSFGNDERRRRGFSREIRILAKLRHAGIAEVYYAGEWNSAGRMLPYFVMEYIEGPSITEYANQQQLSINQRVCLFQKVCDAVEHAHQRGVIHRDLKPSNILTADGNPKVLDFGIAINISTDGTEYSAIGAGTPAYMSPEQFDTDQEQNTPTDIYSLGVILYELISGVLPYARTVESMAQAARTVCSGDQVHLSKRVAHCSLDLVAVVHHCLALRPSDRYRSVGELNRDLQNVLSGRPVSARSLSPLESIKRVISAHRSVAALSLLALALFVAGTITSVWLWQRERTIAEELKDNVVSLEVATKEAEDAGDLLRVQFRERERSRFNHVLALADQHWESSPSLTRQWLETADFEPIQTSDFAYRVQKRRANRKLSAFDEHNYPILSLGYSPQTSTLVSMSESGLLKSFRAVEDQSKWKRIWSRLVGKNEGWSMDASPDGSSCAVLTPAGVRVFRISDCSTLNLLKIDQPISKIEYSTDGEYLIGTGSNKVIFLWSTSFAEPAKVFATPFNRSVAAKINHENRELVAASAGGLVCTWDLDDATIKSSWKLDVEKVSRIAISNDTRWVAGAARFTELKIFDRSTKSLVAHRQNRGERIDRMSFTPNAEWLICSSRQKIVGLKRGEQWNERWSRSTGGDVSFLKVVDNTSYFLGFSSGVIQHLGITAPTINEVLLKDLAAPYNLYLSSDANQLYITGNNFYHIRIDALPPDSTPTVTQRNVSSQANCGAIYSNGMVSLVDRSSWTLKTARSPDFQFRDVVPWDARVSSVAADNKNQLLLIGAYTGVVAQADVAEGTLVHSWVAHPNRVNCIAVASDSGVIATGDFAGEVAIWTSDGKLVRRWKAHSGRIQDLAFSTDGTTLFSASKDCTIGVFDCAAKKRLNTIRPGVDSIRAIEISPDNQTLAIGMTNSSISLHDAVTGEFQCTLRGHRDSVTDLKFTSDGKTLYSISLDNTLRRWAP